jgi:urease accessory protein
VELCHEIGASKLSRGARDASLQMGQARLHAAQMIAPHPFLAAFQATPAAKHLIAVYGSQMALAGVPLQAALAGFFYQSLAGICSAALKLIRIGQDGVQRVLRGALQETAQVVAASMEIARADAGWFSPVLDIAGMRHERAEERLFIS